MKKRITMHDIAKACGVSVMTVSRCLNRKKGVRDDVRERVLKTAGELGYRPDPALSNLDLSSVGGTANEMIVFDVLYTSTGGDPRFSNWGSVAVTGGATADRINVGQTLTSTVSLNDATTFDGTITLGFNRLQVGGLGNPDSYTVTYESGTITSSSGSGAGSRTHNFPLSSFITLAPTSGNNEFQSFDVEVTAIPEPGTLFLVGAAGLVAVLRLLRRKA